MGLEAKEFSTDQELDWPRGGALLQHAGTGELPKPSFKRRQPPTEQQSEPPLNCPRCSSTNTKFCYYNNYNKSQPRYFCKSCKRHWTKGGTLRNVPVGGGRKHKRLRISNAAAAAAAANTAAPAGVSGKDETIMSNILYKALGSINGANPSTEYSFSSFDFNTCVINNPTSSYQSSYGHLDKNYPSNLDSMDESTITTLDIPNGSWPDAGSNLDLPNYWNWNEIDFLSTSHDLNISWDDLDADQF